MGKKLSPTMERALDAIKADGGIAKAEGGGWWLGGSGKRLEIKTNDWRGTDTVVTNTIYALFDRGLLIRCHEGPLHRDTYVLPDPPATD